MEGCHCAAFIDFLISANWVMLLNGPTGEPADGDFTSVSPRGMVVIEYMLVSHGNLHMFADCCVNRARLLFEQTGCVGILDPGVIPDHSLLKWSLDLSSVSGCGTWEGDRHTADTSVEHE